VFKALSQTSAQRCCVRTVVYAVRPQSRGVAVLLHSSVAYTIHPQPRGVAVLLHSGGIHYNPQPRGVAVLLHSSVAYTPSLGAWQSCCTVVWHTPPA